jgi:hypothetical protein
VTSADGPQRGDIRFTGAGDLEIFDGTAWVPVRSVLTDPDIGQRDPLTRDPAPPRDLGPPDQPA